MITSRERHVPRTLLLLAASLPLSAVGCATPRSEAVAPRPSVVRATSLVAAETSTCAVDELGRVHCWGRDCHGAPSDGAFSFGCSRPRIVPGLEGVVSFAPRDVAIDDDCFARRDGAVLCGRVQSGFRVVLPARARTVVHAGTFGCALLDDGKVSCFRISPSSAPLPSAPKLEDMPTTTITGPADVAQLVARPGVVCAVSRSSRLWCWSGRATPEEPIAPFDKSVRRVALGTSHSHIDTGLSQFPWRVDAPRFIEQGGDACRLEVEGGLVCGQRSRVLERVARRSAEIHGLSVGIGGGCALLDGVAHCWWTGRAERDSRVMRGSAPFTDLVAGHGHTCALGTDGSVTCWGANENGEVGAGVKSRYEPATRVRGFGPTGPPGPSTGEIAL